MRPRPAQDAGLSCADIAQLLAVPAVVAPLSSHWRLCIDIVSEVQIAWSWGADDAKRCRLPVRLPLLVVSGLTLPRIARKKADETL